VSQADYFVGFYWNDRRLSLLECLHYMHDVLICVESVFGAPKQFSVSSAKKPVVRTLEELASPSVEGFRFIVDPSLRLEAAPHFENSLNVYTPVGFVATWEVAKGAYIRFCIGAYGAASASNSVVISTDRKYLESPSFMGMWAALLTRLDPDHAVLTSHDLADCIDDGSGSSTLGWITYVRGPGFLSGESELQSRRVAGGTVFSVEPGKLFSTDEQTVAAIREAGLELRARGTL